MPIDTGLQSAIAAVPPIEANTREDAEGTYHDVVHQLELAAITDLQGFADEVTAVVSGLDGAVGDLETAATALAGRVADLESAGPGGAIARPITAGFDGGSVDGTPESVRVGLAAQTRVPFAVTLTGWTLLLQGATGDCTVEVRTKPFASGSFTAITGGSAPSASGGANATGGVSGWTTAVSAGDLLEFEITARSGLVPRATLILESTQA